MSNVIYMTDWLEEKTAEELARFKDSTPAWTAEDRMRFLDAVAGIKDRAMPSSLLTLKELET